MDFWSFRLIFMSLSDYLKNLPEDSSDYKDTQSKHTPFFLEMKHTRAGIHIMQLMVEWKNLCLFGLLSCSQCGERSGKPRERHHEARGKTTNTAKPPPRPYKYEWLITRISFFQDNFQKLMQVQYSLTGHHEIVQPGRVRNFISDDSSWCSKSLCC